MDPGPTNASRLAISRPGALRDSLLALLSSRLLIWAAGMLTAVLLGLHAGSATAFDPRHIAAPFHNTIANVLIAPAARWDSTWYLGIAHSGYRHAAETVFFPLYPGLVALGSAPLGNAAAAIVGILISSACALGALFLLHRLVELELGADVARNTVWIVAWLPVALFLSAVYSESLFLLLAIGSFYAGRLGRWWLAGLLGCLAAATRNSGVLLVVPLVLLYLYGPREDREPDRPASGLRPRYALGADLLWIAAVPIGLLAYLAYLKLSLGRPLAPFNQQHHWHRSFVPLGGVPAGVWEGIKALIAAAPGGASLIGAHLNTDSITRRIVELAFLILGAVLLRLSWKRLPMPYTAFAGLSFLLAVSAPSSVEPLRSLPRFTLMLFPLWIALGLWATERRRVRTVLVVCCPLLVFWTYLFASWTWAA
ncbi:MAG TPA: mannosyltransferase family protein [Solirubrobacterales bacterium]|nr:mannosyltransferase family protein [Solirubrobacterales bacterium]